MGGDAAGRGVDDHFSEKVAASGLTWTKALRRGAGTILFSPFTAFQRTWFKRASGTASARDRSKCDEENGRRRHRGIPCIDVHPCWECVEGAVVGHPGKGAVKRGRSRIVLAHGREAKDQFHRPEDRQMGLCEM